jgi:hypothetical protein
MAEVSTGTDGSTFRVLESPEYTRYIEQLKEISKLWRQRPWIC